MNLLELADSKGIPRSLIYNFIEKGGADYIHEVFVRTMIQEMIEKDFMNTYTPVGAVAHSRDMIAAIFNDFKQQFDKENPE